MSSWRQKYETVAAAAESEEAEEMSNKRKKHMMTARVAEYETQLASAVAKTAALEKTKNQLQLDAESLVVQLDKVHIHSTRVKQTTVYIANSPIRILCEIIFDDQTAQCCLRETRCRTGPHKKTPSTPVTFLNQVHIVTYTV